MLGLSDTMVGVLVVAAGFVVVVAVVLLVLLLKKKVPNPVTNGWFLKAAKEYAARKGDKDTPPTQPLKGTVVAITGTTSGIGEGLTHALHGMGATVVAIGRNPKKLAKLGKDLGNERVIPICADLFDMKTVSKGADEMLKKLDRLDFLVNNAGIHYNDRGFDWTIAPETPQGHDEAFQVNYLSHFLLTEKLLPLIEKSEGMVINMSSQFHWLSNGSELMSVNGEAPGASKPSYSLVHKQRSYPVTKLAQILHMRALQQRTQKAKVRSVCPSWVGTGIVGHGTIKQRFVSSLAFDSYGHGLASTLAAMLLDEGVDFYTNSPLFDACTALKIFHGVPKIIDMLMIRDGLTWNGALLLLFLQKLDARPFKAISSPESNDEQLQESLYNWSKTAVAEFM